MDIVLRAAEQLKRLKREKVRFLIVGDGAMRAELAARTRELKLDNVIFAGRQPKEAIPAFLEASDICLVHLLRKPLFTTVMPSKIFEALALAKPIVLGVEGFAAEVVEQAGAGICIQPENERELVSAVERLAGDRNLAGQLGSAGCEHIAPQYDYDVLAKRYLDVVKTLRRGES